MKMQRDWAFTASLILIGLLVLVIGLGVAGCTPKNEGQRPDSGTKLCKEDGKYVDCPRR